MKTIEDLPQNLRDWLYLWVGVIPKSSVVTQLLEMQKRIEELTVQNKELQERNRQLSEYRFKHSETGDEKLVMIDRQFIVDKLIDEIHESIECNCVAFAENYDFCDCNEYFEEFELTEPNKESK